MTEALSATRIHFGYADRPLFRDFSMSLPEGEFGGVLGPNGAGKTTLLRILSGSVAPSAGEVTLFGSPVARMPARERARVLSAVPQESRVLFSFSVMEVVLMGRFPRLGILGMERPEDVDLARRCLSEVGMEHAADRALNALSSGERQRVFLARALAQEPRVMLLDEPTTFLDLKHRLRIYEILAELSERRKLTILTISHDLNLAARFCRRLWLLKDGSLLAAGRPEEVLVAERIRLAFDTDAEVGRDPRLGTPFVFPYSSRNPGGVA